VKGKTQAVKIYECFDGDLPEMADKKWKSRDLFHNGLQHFYAREFSKAAMAFEEVLAMNPDDSVAKLYMQKSGHLISTGVPESWDGVEVMAWK
jgi:hypothetical protein